ncbi:MAG: hypothetical protein WA797_00410 [Acidimicrobiales bacterium]
MKLIELHTSTDLDVHLLIDPPGRLIAERLRRRSALRLVDDRAIVCKSRQVADRDDERIPSVRRALEARGMRVEPRTVEAIAEILDETVGEDERWADALQRLLNA